MHTRKHWEQARQGLSLDAQLTDLRSYADKHKYNIVEVYTDDGRQREEATTPCLQAINWGHENKMTIVLFIKRWSKFRVGQRLL